MGSIFKLYSKKQTKKDFSDVCKWVFLFLITFMCHIYPSYIEKIANYFLNV